MVHDHKIYLNSFEGAISKKRKRVGRGIGSGRGGTSCAGHKGQSSRSGVTMKRRHAEFARRLPKIGFTSHTPKMSFLTLEILQNYIEKRSLDTSKTISIQQISEMGFSIKNGLKIIGNSISIPIRVQANLFSKGADLAIKNAGGSTEVVGTN